MAKSINLFFISIFCIIFSYTMVSCGNPSTDPSAQAEANIELPKIVSLNGSITETLNALGLSEAIVGVDVTSVYPESIVNNATQLGHIHSIQIEAILALQPDIVLASNEEMPLALKEQLTSSGIRFVAIPTSYTQQGLSEFVHEVAKAVDREDRAEEVLSKAFSELNSVPPLKDQPKILYLYARGSNMLLVSGAGTSIDAIIKFSGAQNAMSAMDAFKPLTTEALVAAQPDVLLMFDMGVESLGGIDAVFEIPGMLQTPAGQNKKVISMDAGLLSNFGPRIGEAALTLNKALQNFEE